MEPLTAIVVAATLINAAKNLYELTLMVGDDPVKQKKYKIETTKYNAAKPARHYYLTVEGNRIIDIEPMD